LRSTPKWNEVAETCEASLLANLWTIIRTLCKSSAKVD
jgi:hypothetical protein